MKRIELNFTEELIIGFSYPAIKSVVAIKLEFLSHWMTKTNYPIPTTTCPSGGNGKTILVSYTILNHTLKNGKVHTIAGDNMRSNWAGYGLETLD